MPAFPVYRGNLPTCLNPLNPRHYLMLAYWVFCRPTALRCYLYQAAPEAYRNFSDSLGDLWVMSRIAACRNLWLMTPILSVVLSLLVTFPISKIWDVPVDCPGVVSGVAFGMTFGAVFGATFGVAGGVAGIIAFSVAFGAAFGVAGGVASSIAGIVAFGVAFGIAFGVAGGVAGGVLGSAAFGVAGGVLGGIEFGVAGGALGGVAFSVAVMGALRLPFYLVYLLPALLGRWGRHHPIAWDELNVLPLPGTTAFLLRQLRQNEQEGLDLLADVTRNPFQRWAVQLALQRYLHDHPQPLRFLFQLLATPSLDTFVFAPAHKGRWGEIYPVRIVLLAELDGRWISGGDERNDRSDRLIYRLTRPLRDTRQTPLTRFAGLLAELLEQGETIEDVAAPFDLARWRAVYLGVQEYPGGAEIAHAFTWMERFLASRSLRDLADASASAALPPPAEPIRPAVGAALAQLDAVEQEIAVYLAATSRANKQAALLRAADALKELDRYVAEEVPAPERHLLRRIVRQWQALIIAEGGALGRALDLRPVANPYILNNPAEGERFVGREDILRRLEELWSPAGQAPSVVIYGHRRMGKTSILHNLGRRFGSQTVIVDFNMQRVGRVRDDADLLYQMALAIFDECRAQGISGIDEPRDEEFASGRPYLRFERFLRRLAEVRAGRRIIVTVDEFEKIEEQIEEGRLTPDLLAFWRGVFTTFPWFVMAFAGLYTLEERRRDYWHPLFGSVTGIKVSFLTPGAARQLITQPSPDFDIDYDEDAIAAIIALTGGQPFLIQLICHTLVTRYNQQTFEEGRERERRFRLADVEDVINAPEFYRDGDAYFSGVWRQAERGGAEGELAILRALAPHPGGLSLDDLAQRAGLTCDQARGALRSLIDLDIIAEREGTYRYTVELMRRWVAGRS